MCWWGWLCFSPVASRVSARQPSYFFLLRQKKVTKKKASHVRAASRCLALLAAFGTLANSLRSNSASVLIRTLLRCSARPNGGGYLSARPLRGPRPNGLFASLTSRGLGVASFLTPHFSQGHGTPCHYGPPFLSLTPLPSRATTRVAPPSSLLPPHPLTPTPHSSLLTPTTSLLPPHSYDLPPHPSFLTCIKLVPEAVGTLALCAPPRCNPLPPLRWPPPLYRICRIHRLYRLYRLYRLQRFYRLRHPCHPTAMKP